MKHAYIWTQVRMTTCIHLSINPPKENEELILSDFFDFAFGPALGPAFGPAFDPAAAAAAAAAKRSLSLGSVAVAGAGAGACVESWFVTATASKFQVPSSCCGINWSAVIGWSSVWFAIPSAGFGWSAMGWSSGL